METKHTKGNWNINRYGIVVDEKGYGISQISGISNEKNWDDNAKLIAAAPELLEACNELLELLSFHGYNYSTEISKAKEAIKKATE